MREEKKNAVDELRQRLISDAECLVITTCTGLSAEDMNELRGVLDNGENRFMVVRNSLIKRAIEGSRVEEISRFIDGPVAIASTREDGFRLVKKLAVFGKEHESLEISGAFFDGGIYAGEDMARIIALPDREVLLGRVAGMMYARLS
ncbi:MAG: 50S ribosomal protein L10, partial [Thermoplasmata archaeon]|nr:50S ribosomal protein L10 [Thermoplasmata archaeon]